MSHPWGLIASVLAMAGSSCAKVPIFDVNAGFALADASWFEAEETLFIFYEATADQGLGDPTVIEITYATDDDRVDWTVVSELPTVHHHEPVDCGAHAVCGSTSLHIPIEPREVAIRLRYHRDGDLALDADTVFNVVGAGDAHSHRSLVIYGVFDETNQRVQWRGRHQFPTIRNEQAQELGLRREFLIENQRYGSADLATSANPYGYGVSCPSSFVSADMDAVGTSERAVFNGIELPLDASDESTDCADSTVWDATGSFTTDAIARKNPEVRAAFPVLRSPIGDATPIEFFLGPCDRTISAEHEAMQRQRLLLGNLPTTCIDDWEDGVGGTDGFVDGLVVAFTDAMEAERASGNDMVLVIGLHQDERGVSEAVEEALARIVPEERHRSSPRLAGAFVFDSGIRGLSLSELDPVTLWCPSTATETNTGASITCAIAPDNPDFELGPFTFGSLPILPSRDQYLDFIETYSVAQAGEVTSLSFRTPEFAATSDHVDIGDFGVVTFLNDEIISADGDDAFSYCVTDEPIFFAFRSEFMQSDEFAALIAEDCEGSDDEICAFAELGLMPIEMLADWHNWFGESTYEIGIFWDFPFLLDVEYEVFFAGSVSAFGFSVPFGIANSAEAYYGSGMWTMDEFSLDEPLTQCRRFCDHPTFDSAGVYHVTDPFRATYVSTCYLPVYPVLSDSGFPDDP